MRENQIACKKLSPLLYLLTSCSWAERDVRPVSLRQLLFFGRALTEARLLSAANYVRTELPTRFVIAWIYRSICSRSDYYVCIESHTVYGKCRSSHTLWSLIHDYRMFTSYTTRPSRGYERYPKSKLWTTMTITAKFSRRHCGSI